MFIIIIKYYPIPKGILYLSSHYTVHTVYEILGFTVFRDTLLFFHLKFQNSKNNLDLAR